MIKIPLADHAAQGRGADAARPGWRMKLAFLALLAVAGCSTPNEVRMGEPLAEVWWGELAGGAASRHRA